MVQKNRLVIVLQLQPWKSTFFRVDVTLAYRPSLFLNAIIFKRFGSICENEWVGLVSYRSSAPQKTMFSISSVCLTCLGSCYILLGIY